MLAALPLLGMSGCKGKLPKGLTSTTLIPTSPKRSVSILKPGDLAPEISGELTFGSNPRQAIGRNEVVVLCHSFGYQSLPHYFYHYKMYPKVRWVYNVPIEETKALRTTIQGLIKQGETVEGLSIVGYDRTSNPAWFGGMGDFLLVQDGRIAAICWENKLDETLMALLQGKFNTNQQLKTFYENQRLRAKYDAGFYPLEQDYFYHRIDFATYTKRYAALLDHVEGDRFRTQAFRTYFVMHGCRPLSEMQPIYDKLAPSDHTADIFRQTAQVHEGHYECRPRLEKDFLLSMRDKKAFEASADDCRSWAINALMLGKKKDARRLLKQMMEAKDLKPVYTRPLRRTFEQDYDNLMWRATQ